MAYSEFYKSLGFNAEIDRLKEQANLGFEKEVNMLWLHGLRDGMKIVEVGSGPGFVTELLLERFPDLKITCVEFDSKLLNYAKERIGDKYGDRVKFVEASIEECPLKSSTYDFVFVRLVYQHLNNPALATKEIHRILKVNGIVAVIDIDDGLWGMSDPDTSFIRIIKEKFASFQQSSGGNRYIGRKLIRLLKASGFRRVDFDLIAKHSDIYGLNNFKMNFDSSKIAPYLNEAMRQVLKQFDDFFKSPKSSLLLIMFFVSGKK